MIFLLILFIIALFLVMGEVVYERDWPRHTGGWLFFFLILLLWSASAYPQGVLFQANITTAQTNVSPGAQAPVLTLPNASITVCADPANPVGGVCTNIVPIYSDAAMTQPIIQPFQADAKAQFSFYAVAGTYDYSVQNSYGTYVGTYIANLPFVGRFAGPVYPGTVLTQPGSPSTPTLSSLALTGSAMQLFGPIAHSGVHRGQQSMTGIVEQFAPDLHCYPGSTNVIGYDYSTGNKCTMPGNFLPATAGTTAELFRNLTFGSGAIPPPPTHWAVTMTDVFDGASNGAEIGMSNCPASSWDCGAANETYAFVRNTGFGIQYGNTSSVLWFTGGNNAGGVSGQSDSGPFGGCCAVSGFQGWSAPPAGAEYDVTMWNPGDGTGMLSIMPQGGKICCGASFRIPLTYPTGAPHQFLTRGFSAMDFVTNVGMAAGYTQQAGLPVYDLPEASTVQASSFLRWSLHANGTEGNYQSGCTDCANVWEFVPPNGKGPRPWVIHVHGNENSIVSLFSDYDSNGANVASTLFQNGFVIVSLDFHSTAAGCPACVYGDPQNVADMAMAIAKVRTASPVPLAAQPYVMADSAGGITLFNAISHGAILPKALIAYSPNASLAWDFGAGGQSGLVESAYNFTTSAQYPSVTAGFDPLAVVQNPLTAQATTGVYPSLLPNAAQVFASIPMLLVTDQTYGSGGDQTVDPTQNSIPFCAGINLIQPGDCTISYIGTGHVSPSKLVGATALGFFNAHQ